MIPKIRVLIVDDSAIARQVLTQILSSDDTIEVVGTAPDAKIGLKKLQLLKPDVMTLDIQMPGMDGLTFLEGVMKSHPLPVVMVSSLTGEGTQEAIKALALGALDVVEKPRTELRERMQEMSIEIVDKIKAAAIARLKFSHRRVLKATPSLTADVILPKPTLSQLRPSGFVIAIGASTGGTEAIFEILKKLPVTSPGVVIVQHMPALFTKSFAERLNQHMALNVKEAVSGDVIQNGTALIAPGDRHMMIARDGNNQYYVNLHDGPLVNRHRPSVNVLFRSVAGTLGPQSIGVILTGMGDDGAQGLLEMKESGAHTIAQDESSSVVFGMPKVAIQLGGVVQVLPLTHIADHLLTRVEL